MKLKHPIVWTNIDFEILKWNKMWQWQFWRQNTAEFELAEK